MIYKWVRELSEFLAGTVFKVADYFFLILSKKK